MTNNFYAITVTKPYYYHLMNLVQEGTSYESFSRGLENTAREVVCNNAILKNTKKKTRGKLTLQSPRCIQHCNVQNLAKNYKGRTRRTPHGQKSQM